MRRFPAFLLAAVLLTGCAHRAKKHAPPDSAPMRASYERMASAVARAKITASKASAAGTLVRQSVAVETKQLEAITPKLEELFRLAPMELRPLIEQAQAEVLTLRAQHQQTVAQVEEVMKQHGALRSDLEEANAAKNLHAQNQEEYLEKAAVLTEKLNVAEEAWAKDSREIVKLRTGSIFFKIAAGLGGIALVGLIALWALGRISLGAASVMR